MPADSQALIRKFVPNNPPMCRLLTKVNDEVFKARFLPMNLVRLLVNKALEELRRLGPENLGKPVFEDKLMEYARTIRPRFQYEIAQLNQRGKRA